MAQIQKTADGLGQGFEWLERLHRIDEKTDPENLVREVNLDPVRQTDLGKLARQADLSPACDNGLVLNQKECSDDALAV